MLVTGTFTYPSTIDSGIGNLFGKFAYDGDCGFALPVCVLMHGYIGDAGNFTADDMARYAGYKFLTVALGMRGRDGASGTPDSSGREIHDIYDGIQYVRHELLPSIAHPTACLVVGYSGGGGNAFAMGAKFPDTCGTIVSFFGMSDYGNDTTFGWVQYASLTARTSLIAQIGDRDLATSLGPYRSRNAIESIPQNLQSRGPSIGQGPILYMFVSPQDGDVQPSQSLRMQDAMIDSGLSDRSLLSVSTDWAHALPSQNPRLIQAESIFATIAFQQQGFPIKSRGKLRVVGYVVTSLFEIWLGTAANPKTSAGGGTTHAADVEYDVHAGSYIVTPLTSGAFVVQVIQYAPGAVLKTIQATITAPTQIQVNAVPAALANPLAISGGVLWIPAIPGAVTLVGSDVSVWTDQTSAGNNGTQGAGNRPEFHTVDGADAVSFVGASSERLNFPDLFDPQGDYTIAIVAKPTNQDAYLWSQSNTAVNFKDQVVLRHGPTALIHDYLTSSGATGEIGAPSTVAAWHTFFLMKFGDTIYAQVDGGVRSQVRLPSGTNVANVSTLGAVLSQAGYLNFATFDMRDMAVWPFAVPDTQQQALRFYYEATYPGLP